MPLSSLNLGYSPIFFCSGLCRTWIDLSLDWRLEQIVSWSFIQILLKPRYSIVFQLPFQADMVVSLLWIMTTKSVVFFSSGKEMLQEITFVCFDKVTVTEMNGGYLEWLLRILFFYLCVKYCSDMESCIEISCCPDPSLRENGAAGCMRTASWELCVLLIF